MNTLEHFGGYVRAFHLIESYSEQINADLNAINGNKERLEETIHVNKALRHLLGYSAKQIKIPLSDDHEFDEDRARSLELDEKQIELLIEYHGILFRRELEILKICGNKKVDIDQKKYNPDLIRRLLIVLHFQNYYSGSEYNFNPDQLKIRNDHYFFELGNYWPIFV